MSLDQKHLNELSRVSYELRKKAVEMVYHAKKGHAAPALSMAEIVSVLYFEKMNIDPRNPRWEDRDRFVLSKGHACCLYYAALAKAGFFPEEDLLEYRVLNSKLQGHPDMRKVPGCDMTTGSLGNGIAGALGMAWTAKRDAKKHHVFCIAGDGEIDEGIAWEAFMCAGNAHLDNLILFVDANGLQSGGTTSEIMDLENLEDKFRAFKWEATTIDGHDVAAICNAVDYAVNAKNGKPHAIIAKTVKGKGVSYMEGQYMWHMKAPTDEQYEIAMKELTAAEEQFA